MYHRDSQVTCRSRVKPVWTEDRMTSEKKEHVTRCSREAGGEGMEKFVSDEDMGGLWLLPQGCAQKTHMRVTDMGHETWNEGHTDPVMI